MRVQRSTDAPQANDLDMHVRRAARFCGTIRKCERALGVGERDRTLDIVLSIVQKFCDVDVATTLRQLSEAPGGASSYDECAESAE